MENSTSAGKVLIFITGTITSGELKRFSKSLIYVRKSEYISPNSEGNVSQMVRKGCLLSCGAAILLRITEIIIKMWLFVFGI
jgi:hypothetical protein